MTDDEKPANKKGSDETSDEAVDEPATGERGPEAGQASASARYGTLYTQSRGQDVLHPRRDELIPLVVNLRDEHGFRVCVDVTAVDYLVYDAPRDLPEEVTPERYEVVIGVLSHVRRERLRLRVQVPQDDPTIPSLFDVYPGSEGLEREVFDMFGIRFEGHPDMTRILMPEDWEGHPLRKQYPVGTIPVQFKGVSNAR